MLLATLVLHRKGISNLIFRIKFCSTLVVWKYFPIWHFKLANMGTSARMSRKEFG